MRVSPAVGAPASDAPVPRFRPPPGGESLRALRARIRWVVQRLRSRLDLPPAAMNEIAGAQGDPYEILVGTVISLRTRDEVTVPATRRLLALAPDAASLERLAPRVIEKAIYPAGFYRTKSRQLRAIALLLRQRYGGRVPDRMEELLSLPGVGRKTANLVLLLGHGIAALCVDTHVHRVSNRLGFVRTARPDETEMALRERLPRPLWWDYNELMVRFGRNVCTPLSPRCSTCEVAARCPRVGVTRSR